MSLRICVIGAGPRGTSVFPGDFPEVALAEAARLGPDDYPTRSFYGHYLEWVVGWLLATAPANENERKARTAGTSRGSSPSR